LTRFVTAPALALLLAAIAGCGGEYSPNTYSATAVQQANKVAQGVVVGVREIKVSASETVGAVAGGAVGGIAGSQVPGSTLGQAFGTVGGTMIGGLVGAGAEHAVRDTKAFEYIVRKTTGELVSVTQKDEVPLAIGQHVLVIAGNQARIVPDYIVPVAPGEETAKAKTPVKPVPAAAPVAASAATESVPPAAATQAAASATPSPETVSPVGAPPAQPVAPATPPPLVPAAPAPGNSTAN
jgi:outer membrane lipoprotein SlyB